jgi:SAM-dependent methyltransferase
MSESFDVNAYWLERGRGYAQERLPGEYHRLQEQFLLRLLHEGGVPMRRVLELGCGFGRVTKLLASSFPQTEIAALDLSPEQLDNARQYCAGLTNITFRRYDFYSGESFPGHDRWDTAIAVEVFLHHPESLLRDVISKLAQVTGLIVNIDWSEAWSRSTPEHVWVHDYAALYRDAGLRCATFVLPEKTDGLQQKLFVAGCELPGAITALERQLDGVSTHPDRSPSGPPPVVDWMQRLERAITELRKTIPANSAVVLVNDGQWGCETKALPALRVIPFLERGGQYWGAPEDSAEALRELKRLEQAGAKYLAVAWNSFWWLDYYREFHQHLRRRCKCVFSTDDLIIFRL